MGLLVIFTALIGIIISSVDSQHAPNCADGRHVIVHLFEWKWTDIAQECERFLGPKGFCGVQISPPNEHRVISDPWRPWWQRYQPVSYKLVSRSGDESEFRDMVERCNNVDVRIYADVVVNHMARAGYQGQGSAGSDFNSNSLNFTGVPYGPNDFNCCWCSMCVTASCSIESYVDANQVRNCRLDRLTDLALGNDYVRGKVTEYLNKLIDIGVAGFRVDAAKHMWPGDMEIVFSRLNKLNSQWWPAGTQPFITSEVIYISGSNEPIRGSDYTYLGRVTEFNYGGHLGRAFRKQYPLRNLITFGETWGMLQSENSLVFIDNHDNQRGHGAGGKDILSFYFPKWYNMAVAFMLAHPFGFTRLMSSYRWDGGPYSNDWIGPPSHSDGSTKDVPINADGTCGDDWVCEHRWRQITNMVYFRNVVTGTGIEHWWDNGNHQIAFSRGDRGFIAFNNDDSPMNVYIRVSLPPGQYCDIISGGPTVTGCSGTIVTVGDDGNVHVDLSNSLEDPMIAIHTYARPGSGGGSTVAPPTSGPTTPPPTRPPGAGDFQRTVVFLKASTVPGQNVFIRGGISHGYRDGCTNDVMTSACALTIQHNYLGNSSHYTAYNAWKTGDNYLDWYGAESGQGKYLNEVASGTPEVWTTDNPNNNGYQPINVYGEHYWMTDFNMDCSESENGWFELKGFVTNYSSGWETNISQDAVCTGSVGGNTPYSSTNHLARCGYINVFEFNDNACRIDSFNA
ncbi:unnamed protein product [Owenia fusiformis]|uniref:Alpha-amylase n=1 Tax=Owenia fusiformis TaxID=6347 RepID=A0A8S4PBP0_OWEFU|nr:unnamed protein product [Owenia fusiformis]